MPLYTWPGGWVLKLGGPGMMPLRYLSLAATLITASLLYVIGRREGASRLIAFAGAAVFLAAIAGGYLLLAVRRRAWTYALALILVAGVPTLWLEVSSGGWFSHYMLDVAYASPISWRRVANTLLWEVMGAMAVLALSFALVSALSFRRHRWQLPRRKPWLLFTPAALMVSPAGSTEDAGRIDPCVRPPRAVWTDPLQLCAQHAAPVSPHERDAAGR